MSFAQLAPPGELVAFTDANKLMGLKTEQGVVVVPGTYDYIYFETSYWVIGNSNPTRVGMMDLDGKVVLEPKYEKIFPFEGGLASVYVKEEDDYYEEITLWGFINMQGEEVLPCKYEHKGYVSYGIVAMGSCERGCWEYYDTAGKQLTTQGFDDAKAITKDGLAQVKKGGKFGYVNREGTLAIPMLYATATNFLNGVASVQLTADGEKFNIDTKGNRVR